LALQGISDTPGNSIRRAGHGTKGVGVRRFGRDPCGSTEKHRDPATLVHPAAWTVDILHQGRHTTDSVAEPTEREQKPPLDPLLKRLADFDLSGLNLHIHGVAPYAVSLEHLSLMGVYAVRRNIEI